MVFAARAAACAAALVLFVLLAPGAWAQTTADVVGQVTAADGDDAGASIPGATVLVQGTSYGTAADGDGRYRLRIAEGTYVLQFSSVGYLSHLDTVTVVRRTTTTLDVALSTSTETIGTVEVSGNQGNVEPGVYTIAPQVLRNIPDPFGNDALRAVNTLPGVTSNNELSNAYSVRGGGYNENQFFLDGFEVYRPFRTSQGEQEGLGLINSDLASSFTLYAGGFPSRYGGKLASVLDVGYVRPESTAATMYASGLDQGLTVQAALFNRRIGLAVATRRATGGRLFATQELEGVYQPEFRDVQGVVDWRIASGQSFRVIGLLARHRFDFQPQQRRTTFGVFPDQIRTVAFQFVGQETDGYDVGFLGARLSNRLGGARGRILLEHEASVFDTDEIEVFDVSGGITVYRVRDPNQSPDDPLNLLQTGSAVQRDVADNEVGVRTITGTGRYRALLGQHAAEGGWQYRQLRFRDRLSEYTQISGQDSLGFPVLVTGDSLGDAATVLTGQQAAWLEDAVQFAGGRALLTGGVRFDHFDLTDEWTVSPRLSGRYRVNDFTMFTMALGRYYQQPTYRELRPALAPGSTQLPDVNTGLRSQSATIGVLGVNHLFRRTRFSLRGEAYYKQLGDLISYEVENTAVVYSGVNDSEGYAYGLDLQLRGEFVPGLESWLNYGFLVARERFFGPADDSEAAQIRFQRQGGGAYIPRPTDRRHNIALFVQDHIPGDDTWTLHLRALFGTGNPFTPPSLDNEINGAVVFEPGQRNALRYPEYFRFDMGATKTAVLGDVSGRPVRVGLTAEVLNVFDQKNTIAYSFVDSGQGFYEGVPTRLTPRTVNVRLRLDF